jgi:hypothetical protein
MENIVLFPPPFVVEEARQMDQLVVDNLASWRPAMAR